MAFTFLKNTLKFPNDAFKTKNWLVNNILPNDYNFIFYFNQKVYLNF